MVRNYLKIAWRNITRNKLLSLINLMGLSIGVASVMFIGLYIQQELSYDQFHAHRDELFRVGFTTVNEGKAMEASPGFVAAFAPEAQEAFPEIKAFCRVSGEQEAILVNNEQQVKAGGMIYADSSFFRLFSFPLREGNAATALTQPYSIVLTPELAQQLFGKGQAVGQLVRVNNRFDYQVTGIVEAPLANSQLKYCALLSLSGLYKDTLNNYMGWNGGNQYTTYFQLHSKQASASLQRKLPDFMWQKINSQYATRNLKIIASLQPFSKVHLWHEADSVNTRTNLYVFGIIALMILVISAVNYINLAIAQSSSRFKEVGVRKVLGAARGQLIRQFIGESLFITFISFLMALIVVYMMKPVYEQLTGLPLLLWTTNSIAILIPAVIILLWMGVGAGSYLAFYLSSLKVQQIFRSVVPKTKHTSFRKALIVGQFVISIGLMTCTLIVHVQMKYIKNKPLGFDKEHIIVLPLMDDNTQESAGLLQQQIKNLPDVVHVTALSQVPHAGIDQNGFVPEGTSSAMIIHQLDGDEEMLKTLGLHLTLGRYFSSDRPADKGGYLINETLARSLGWQHPLGRKISRDGDHEVIGVVKDFAFASLHDKIEPLIITNNPWQGKYAYLAVRYKTESPAGLLQALQQMWQKQVNTSLFEYWFLDEAFDKVYHSERRFQQLFFWFSMISMLLSLAGVFGLVMLFIRQRTKEFGIRRVLGAEFVQIAWLTARSFLQMIVLSSLIAIPLAWYYANEWLASFAFQASLHWWMFLMAGLLVSGIAVATICLQVFQSMRKNPVKNLETQ